MSLGLYLHVPFCQAICSYCNFNRGLFDPGLKTRYVDALEREIREAGAGEAADTIFFGGGTPSLLEPDEIARLISACRRAYAPADEAEITLETNPETATIGRLQAFRAAGVNRISFGVQSFDDAELQRLGRIHSAARAEQAIHDARRAGFGNLSLDLMLWLPGQSLDSWMRSVERAIALAPDHLSLYLLELYPNAPLREAMARTVRPGPPGADGADAGAWVQAADDEGADMYLAGFARLDAAGFAQYQISNVARPGRESRHNLKYWQAGDWRGFGCGAHSTVAGVRWQNVASASDYVERMASNRTVALDKRSLSAGERSSEALFTGLRLSAGVHVRNFEDRFGVNPWHLHEAGLSPMVDEGLVWRSPDRFGLTRRGMLVANEILSAFV